MEPSVDARPLANLTSAGPVPVDEIRQVAEFEGLSEAVYDWLAEHATYYEVPVGERVFRSGQEADSMVIVLGGAIQLVLDVGGQPILYDTFEAGRVVGVLPYSRMTHYTGSGLVVEPVRMVVVQKADFPAMLETSEELGRRLVALMSDRVREATRSQQQREKMMALGKLSAGLAHELNNPAAAIRRSAAELGERVAQLPELVARMTQHAVTAEQVRQASDIRATAKPAPDLSTVERGEQEDDLADRLEALGVDDGWRLAEVLVDAGFTAGCLDDIAGGIPDVAVPDVLRWIEGGLAADRLLAEIESAASRISGLVGSVKSYSHMDQAPACEATDVPTGIDSTVTMLGHKIKKQGVRFVRTIPSDLPRIPAYAGALNQVWTNLLDNALDAAGEGGTIEVAAEVAGEYLCVSVIDDGAGVPEDIQSRIFEPFFTTKGVGEGTGLGLDVVQRIVVKQHRGTLDLESEPGRTVFTVCLPLDEGG
ncbi:MAG: ATP-binding protein [Bacteroidota bacterium]